MKSIVVAVIGLLSGALFAAESVPSVQTSQQKKTAAKKASPSAKMTFEKACEHITEVVKNPALMGEITSQLSAQDQKKFMIEVNKAIVSMPGSNEQKTATFLNVERAALLAAEKGNLQPMVATMFKTVTLESLTVLADRYAEDLFNRDADATQKFTDEQFTEIAASTVGEVAKECRGLSDEAPRDTLAIYLFEKSSNDSIPDLEDRLLEVAFSDSQTRSIAKNEWLAEAKNTGNADRFSSLLGYADAGRAPNADVVLQLAGPQMLAAQVNDLAQGVMDASGNQIMPVTQGESATGRDTATANQIVQQGTQAATATQPKTGNPTQPYNPQYSRDQVQEAHPGGYQYQN